MPLALGAISELAVHQATRHSMQECGPACWHTWLCHSDGAVSKRPACYMANTDCIYKHLGLTFNNIRFKEGQACSWCIARFRLEQYCLPVTAHQSYCYLSLYVQAV